MSGVALAFKELLRSFGVRAWCGSAAAVAGVTLSVAAVAFYSLLVEPGGARVPHQVVAVPRADRSQAELGELFYRLQQDPGVAGVRYRFPEEANPGRFEIRLRFDADPELVIRRLEGWDAFREVAQPSPLPPGAVRAWIARPESRELALVSLLVLLGTALVALYVGVRTARASFAGELELLRLSGVDPVNLRAPFALLGGLYGLGGSLLVAALARLGVRWAQAAPLGAEGALRELSKPGTVEALGLRAVVLGLAFALVGAGLGWLVSRTQRYPRPLSRSRISSSSAGPSGV